MPGYVPNKIFSYLEFQHSLFCMFKKLIALPWRRVVKNIGWANQNIGRVEGGKKR